MLQLPTLSGFSTSYHQARQYFWQTVGQLPAQLVQQQQECLHPLPGPEGEDLFLDWLCLGQQAAAENVLVIISGTHGVEGFTGSAIQSHWLNALTEQLQQHANLGLVLIHALNPWGFAWSRRYDHQGIDLNRNFVDFSQPLPENPEYDQVHKELFSAPTETVPAVLAKWRAQLGEEKFATVITQGQYQHADGLFYGGHASSWSRQLLENLCAQSQLNTARRIAVIDLHTGLGPFGHGEVINDHNPDTTGFDLANSWYGPNAQSALLGDACSPPKTGLLDYFWHQLMGERGCFVTLEYGTDHLEKLLSVSIDEQRYHNSYAEHLATRDIEQPVVRALQTFFYPQDPTWRELVLFRAGQVFSLALQGLLR